MSLRILLADENLAVQKLVEMTLSSEDVDLTITDNGLSALDIAIKHRPDLILADYKMSGLDVFSFVKKAKKREDISGIPIILLVDSAETHDPIYLQSLGVEAFLKKPIDTEKLNERIKSLSLLSEPEVETPGEVSSNSELSQHFTSADDDSKMISDLLGWSTPEDSSQITPAPSETALKEEDEDEVDSDPEIQTGTSEAIQVDPHIQENDFPPLAEYDAETPESSMETSEDSDASETLEAQTPAPDNFPFETGALFSDEAQAHTEEEALLPTLEHAEQDEDENTNEGGEQDDLLQTPVFGETIIIPQEEEDLNPPTQETEMEPPFAFEESDPFSQTEQVDLEAEDRLQVSPMDEAIDDSLEVPDQGQSDLLETSQGEIGTKEEGFDAAPDEQEESALSDPSLNNELIRKMVQETAERIAKEMLPDLVKSSLSQEMISPIIEGVAWELVPVLAESEIKKEIKRLQPEKEES